MREYRWAKSGEPFFRDHRWFEIVDQMKRWLQEHLPPQLEVRSSVGRGGWAKVPWLVIASPRESTSHGLFVQLLWRADATAVYLSLGQGTTKLRAALGSAGRAGTIASRHHS